MKKTDSSTIREEKGAVDVVEMTFVFPLVLAMVFFLFFIANCVLQSVYLYSDAQKLAVLAARTIEMPGYSELYKDTSRIETTADFSFGTETKIDRKLVEAIMRHHDPYRYITNAFKSTLGEGSGALEKASKNMLKRAAFMGADDYKCDIGVTGGMFSRTVRVTVSENIWAPMIVKLLGRKDSYKMEVTAYAGISDSADFVRNSEMVCDLADYLYDNLKIGSSGKTMSDMVNDFKEKINSLKGKFGLKMGD